MASYLSLVMLYGYNTQEKLYFNGTGCCQFLLDNIFDHYITFREQNEL